MRLLVGLTSILMVAAVGTASAITRLRIESDVGDPIGRGVTEALSPPDAVFMVFASSDGYVGVQVDKFASPNLIETSWEITFAVPAPVSLQPGTYENAVYDPTPGSTVSARLEVIHDSTIPSSVECPRATGRFTIYAIEFDGPSDERRLRSLVADFELRCDGRTAALRGSLDLFAGDPDCDGAPDGSPCDDVNPCTTDDHCVAGACEASATLLCRDGIPTTDDVCVRHVGCRFPPAVSIWGTTGVATITAVGPGGSATRRSPTRGLLELVADGTYVIPSRTPPCPEVPEPVVLHGTWRATRRERLLLEAANATDIANALVACDPRIQRARVVGARHVARIGKTCPRKPTSDPDKAICGRQTTRLRLRVLGQTVGLTVEERYSGERLDEGEYTPPTARH